VAFDFCGLQARLFEKLHLLPAMTTARPAFRSQAVPLSRGFGASQGADIVDEVNMSPVNQPMSCLEVTPAPASQTLTKRAHSQTLAPQCTRPPALLLPTGRLAWSADPAAGYDSAIKTAATLPEFE
jgi:hypothetical protein